MAEAGPISSSHLPQSASELLEDRLACIKKEKKARRKAGKQKAQLAETAEDAAAETTPVPQKKPKDKKKAKKAAKQARKAVEGQTGMRPNMTMALAWLIVGQMLSRGSC